MLCIQPFSSKETVCLSPHVSLIVTDKEEKSKALYMLVDKNASLFEFSKRGRLSFRNVYAKTTCLRILFSVFSGMKSRPRSYIPA